jgi:hypothetical protein
MEAVQLLGEAHVIELAYRARREPVAARLLPREALAFEQHHVVAGVGEPVGARGPGRTRAHDEDIVVAIGGHAH